MGASIRGTKGGKRSCSRLMLSTTESPNLLVALRY
jgi:hypothetical protein